MHITTKDVELYVQKLARQYDPKFDEKTVLEQTASCLGIAQVVIWDLIMDLDPDKRVKIIKKIK